MEYIELKDKETSSFTILVFVEGTILKPKSWYSLYNHKSYIPIGDCVNIIHDWQEQGANIIYCTSRKGKQAQNIANLLVQYGFCGSRLYYRNQGEKYKSIIEYMKPNILIEDDCKSIGGSWQMCITHVNPEVKKSIISIVVKEFKGIDNLPKSICDL